MYCHVSNQIAEHCAIKPEEVRAEFLDNLAHDLVTKGYCSLGAQEIGLENVIYDLVEADEIELIIKIADLIVCPNEFNAREIRELLEPYALIAVEKEF